MSAVHLHVHSEYSLLDGACKIPRLAERCAQLEMPALGLTDHGVMNGSVELYKACRKQGVKPILGMEAYFVDDVSRPPKQKVELNHLTLLATSDEGFRNLIKLSSKGFLEGFRRGKPTIDLALLDAHSNGLVCLSGCLQSRFIQRILAGRLDDARAHVDDLLRVFGTDDFYFEVQRNRLPDQDRANEQIVRIAREMGRPLVGTADVHYLRREDYDHHAALLCVQTKSTLEAPKITFDTNEFYLKSPEEMNNDFAEWPEAVATTLEIAERCNVEMELGGMLLPSYPCPDGEDARSYLRVLAEEGLRERYGDPPPAAAAERLEQELEVISRMGFDSYFLIVWDFVRYAKDNGVAVGPGRGSAAGSIVSYCLNITDVDPLAYDLLFERFLNPERKSMPDIDIDFSTAGRERVIRYVADKYGSESVAQIITFGRMAPKAATRDAGRVLGYSYGEVDRIAKLVPEPVMGRNPTFADCLKDGQELRKAYDSDTDARRMIDVAKGLEGIVRNNSIHAAAVVIADRPLMDFVPLQLAEDRGGGNTEERSFRTVTQYSMKPIEEIGLLKMDFLGLRNLDVLESAVDIIERSTGERIDLKNLPLDDRKTYEMLARGDSVGVFQMESEGMRDALRRVKPDEFADLIALVALYRPGAMRYIDDYARGKRDPKSVKYLDPRLSAITTSTYGVTLYQEQNMEIAKQLAGFSGAKADDLRYAIGKKKQVLMDSMRADFIGGCIKNGVDRRTAEKLWADNQAAADYSFNKCASRETCVILPDGKRIRLSRAYKLQPAEIMSMWPDGEVRPHKVERIVRTGRKHLVRVRTASGRQIKATPDHRLLTTEGYKRISELEAGTELITLPRISEAQREARRKTMMELARRPERKELDRRAAARMRAYQATRSYEEKATHMKRMHAQYPDLTRNAVAAMHERVKWLHANDARWRRRQIEQTIANVRDCYDTGPGYGRCSIASNGIWCASQPERDMCEWLIAQGIEFEMHKVLANGRISDFYFGGLYWEMDGMDRIPELFAEKYGDLPYVVVTPEDFKFVVEAHLQRNHAENGDPIVSIEPYGQEMTYDIEMSADGPLNYIANGIVSHNSHAACYALIAYRTAYLRANYPAEYMAALISSVMQTKDKVPFFVSRCEEMGIKVLPPDVNSSSHDFVVVGGDIRFGLDAVKNVGYSAVAKIVEARESGGEFKSIWDFCRRVDAQAVNKRALESLVKCGAFDSTGASRKGLLEDGSNGKSVMERAQAAGQDAQKDRASGQGSLLGELGQDAQLGGDPPIPVVEQDKAELLRWEKETLGLFLSSHPLADVREALSAQADCSLSELASKPDGAWVTVGGLITAIKRMRTKKGEPMVFATLDDLDGTVEMLAFNSALASAEAGAEAGLAVDGVVLVRGRVDHKERGEVKLVAQDVSSFVPGSAAAPASAKSNTRGGHLVVSVERERLSATTLNDLKQVFEHFPGEAEVVLALEEADGSRSFRLGGEYRVTPSSGFVAELQAVLGPSARVA